MVTPFLFVILLNNYYARIILTSFLYLYINL